VGERGRKKAEIIIAIIIGRGKIIAIIIGRGKIIAIIIGYA